MTAQELEDLIGQADERTVSTLGANSGKPWRGLVLRYKFRDWSYDLISAYEYNTFALSLSSEPARLAYFDIKVMHRSTAASMRAEPVELSRSEQRITGIPSKAPAPQGPPASQQEAFAESPKKSSLKHGGDDEGTSSLESTPAGPISATVDALRPMLQLQEATLLLTQNAAEVAKTAPSLAPEEIAAAAMPYIHLIKSYDEHGQLIRSGTGFMIVSAFVGITNYHVVEDAESVTSTPVCGELGGKELCAIVAYGDKELDLAIIMIGASAKSGIASVDFDADYERLPAFGLIMNTGLPAVGERVYVIGNPLGLEGTFSSGEISGLRAGLIQITAPISPGSSGGPVLSAAGFVVGVATLSQTDGQNINFAIPSQSIVRAIQAWAADTAGGKYLWSAGYDLWLELQREHPSITSLAREAALHGISVGDTESLCAFMDRCFSVVREDLDAGRTGTMYKPWKEAYDQLHSQFAAEFRPADEWTIDWALEVEGVLLAARDKK